MVDGGGNHDELQLDDPAGFIHQLSLASGEEVGQAVDEGS